jgi:hypothetical protein
MKIWFANRKTAKDDSKNTLNNNAPLADKEISDDLMAQITGGMGKSGCHTASLA